jgi:hypothetical protein
MRKTLIILLFGVLIFPISSKAVNWPGTGACAGSLQACIDAVSDNGTINVVTDTPILSGTYTITKGLTLQAGDGYHPSFSNITLINISASSGKKVTVKGFIFKGYAYIDAFLTINNELNILNNTWMNPSLTSNQFEGIQVHTSTALIIGNSATINIIGNDIKGGGQNGAFGFVDITNGFSGVIKTNIIDNHINISNTNEPIIFIVNSGNGQIDAQITANQLYSQYDVIRFSQTNLGGQSHLNIAILSNLMTGGLNLGQTANLHDLINSNVTQGQFNGIIGNNTFDGGNGTSIAMNFINHTTTSLSSINILNNIIVNSNEMYHGPSSGASNIVTSGGNNIFYNTGSNLGLSLISSDINSDPKFIKTGINYALQASSPAIDNSSIFGAESIYQGGWLSGSPRIDADGLRRYKGILIDSGAFEWGDRHIFHKVNSPLDNGTFIADTSLNADANAMPIVTSVWNYENLPGIYHDHPIGVLRFNAIWGVVNEDISNMLINEKFHIFYPYGVTDSGSLLNGLYQWTKDATTNTGFDLGSPLLDNNTQSAVFASNFWDGNNSPVYNPHSLEVGYKFTNNKWFLANSDGINMPTNSKFFTYNQDYSRNVFNLKVTTANTQGNVTVIDHPLLNGNPCALPTVTQVAPFGLLGPVFGNNPHHIGIFYSSLGKWAIFNQDLVAFDTTILGAPSFNVLVDPQQVYECNTKILFADGFE